MITEERVPFRKAEPRKITRGMRRLATKCARQRQMSYPDGSPDWLRFIREVWGLSLG